MQGGGWQLHGQEAWAWSMLHALAASVATQEQSGTPRLVSGPIPRERLAVPAADARKGWPCETRIRQACGVDISGHKRI